MTKTKQKSRVSKSSKKSGFKFHWWFAMILVLLVAVIGLVIVRFSFAGTSYDVVIDDSTAARDKFYLRLFNQGSSVRGSIVKHQIFGGWQGQPGFTEWRMTLDNGFVACGRLYNSNSKDISNPSLPTNAKWVVTNPQCGKG